MTIEKEIINYINSLSEQKKSEVDELHKLIIKAIPNAQLWFLDGTNEEGKVVTNPNIGYGNFTLNVAGGKTREFYKVGLSATTTGISVYIMGVENKNHLNQSYGSKIGKAKITGYCIKFNKLNDINVSELIHAIKSEYENKALNS